MNWRRKSGEVTRVGRVFDFMAYKYRNTGIPSKTVYYVSDHGIYTPLLQSFPFLNAFDLRTQRDLRQTIKERSPEMMLIEASIHLEDPFALIQSISEDFSPPIILLAEPHFATKKNLKKAFSVGVSDTLRLPLERDELLKAIEVLFRIQLQASLYQ